MNSMKSFLSRLVHPRHPPPQHPPPPCPTWLQSQAQAIQILQRSENTEIPGNSLSASRQQGATGSLACCHRFFRSRPGRRGIQIPPRRGGQAFQFGKFRSRFRVYADGPYTEEQARSGAGSLAPPFYTVDDALTSLRFGKFQWLLLGYTALAWAAEAMELLLLSFIGPAATDEWGLQGGQEALLSSVVFVGMLLGAYAWGLLADSKGRRVGFAVTALLTAFAGLASAAAPSFPALLATRALVGVGLGGAPVVFSLFMELVPPAERGFWLIGVSVFWTAGSVLEAGLAWAILPTLGWRWLVAVSAAPFLLLLLLFPLLPESPRFLLTQGRPSEALAMLKGIGSLNRRALPPGQLVVSLPGSPEKGTQLSASEEGMQFSSAEYAADSLNSEPLGEGAVAGATRALSEIVEGSTRADSGAGKQISEVVVATAGEESSNLGEGLNVFRAGSGPDGQARDVDSQDEEGGPGSSERRDPGAQLVRQTVSEGGRGSTEWSDSRDKSDRSGKSGKREGSGTGSEPNGGMGGVQGPVTGLADEGLLSGAAQRLSLLFSPPLRRTTTLLWVVFFASAFSYYGFVLLTTQVSSSLSLACLSDVAAHGAAADVMASSADVMASSSDVAAAGEAAKSPYLDILVTSAGELPGLLAAAFLVDRIGCKRTMASMLLGASLCYSTELPGLLVAAFLVDRIGRKRTMASMLLGASLCSFALLAILGAPPAGLVPPNPGAAAAAVADVTSAVADVTAGLGDVITTVVGPVTGAGAAAAAVTGAGGAAGAAAGAGAAAVTGAGAAAGAAADAGLGAWGLSLGMPGVSRGSLVIPVLFVARACVMGAFQTVFAYAPEVYPTSMRTTGLGAASSFSRLGGVACPFVAVNLLRSCNEGAAFAVFGIVPLIASVAALGFTVETSGRELYEEIPSTTNDA